MSTGPEPAAAAGLRGEVVPGEDDGGPLLRFRGVIDREAVRRFRLTVPPASWPARVDLSGVTSIDAAGLELVVHLDRKPRRRGGQLEVLGLPTELRPVLARAGLSRLLPNPEGTPTSA